MLKKNNLLFGVLAALIFPTIAWLIAGLLANNVYLINKPAMPYFVAIALNLVLIRISFTKGADKTARGTMLTTFAVMVLVFILKTHPIR
ncbi:MAG TPA: hypothetical protein DCO83_16540 [Mucilaginibacter sp.]|jgi:hypothetical protein|nr:hypothetical protein [Mucilaginibacter sp.]